MSIQSIQSIESTDNKCPHCSLSFSNKSNLTTHIKTNKKCLSSRSEQEQEQTKFSFFDIKILLNDFKDEIKNELKVILQQHENNIQVDALKQEIKILKETINSFKQKNDTLKLQIKVQKEEEEKQERKQKEEEKQERKQKEDEKKIEKKVEKKGDFDSTINYELLDKDQNDIYNIGGLPLSTLKMIKEHFIKNGNIVLLPKWGFVKNETNIKKLKLFCENDKTKKSPKKSSPKKSPKKSSPKKTISKITTTTITERKDISDEEDEEDEEDEDFEIGGLNKSYLDLLKESYQEINKLELVEEGSGRVKTFKTKLDLLKYKYTTIFYRHFSDTNLNNDKLLCYLKKN